MGGNVNAGVFHPLQLMDFLQRKHNHGLVPWKETTVSLDDGSYISICEEVGGQALEQMDRGRGAINI